MKAFWPEASQVIFIGGCIKRGEGSSFRARAHAHNERDDPWFGWICFRSAKRLGVLAPDSDRDFDYTIVKASRILWHEWGHILTPNHGHDDAWRAKMRDLDQPIPQRYRKRAREA